MHLTNQFPLSLFLPFLFCCVDALWHEPRWDSQRRREKRKGKTGFCVLNFFVSLSQKGIGFYLPHTQRSAIPTCIFIRCKSGKLRCVLAFLWVFPAGQKQKKCIMARLQPESLNRFWKWTMLTPRLFTASILVNVSGKVVVAKLFFKKAKYLKYRFTFDFFPPMQLSSGNYFS